MEQFFGWVGNLGFFLGAIYLAKKQIKGFYAQIFANLAYLIQSILMNNYALFWLSFMLIIINGYGIFKWSK